MHTFKGKLSMGVRDDGADCDKNDIEYVAEIGTEEGEAVICDLSTVGFLGLASEDLMFLLTICPDMEENIIHEFKQTDEFKKLSEENDYEF